MRKLLTKHFTIKPDLKVFCVLILAISIGASTYSPIISRYLETFTSNPILIGILATLAWGFYMLLAEPAGDLCSKLGCKRMLLFGALLAASGALVIFAVQNVFVYIFATFLWGTGDAFFWSAAQKLVADLSVKRNRSFSFGLYTSSWGFGWAFGPLLGGFAAYTWGLRVPFLFFGAIVLACLPFFIKFVPDTGHKNIKFYPAFKGIFLRGKALSDGLTFFRNSSKNARFALAMRFTAYSTFALVEIFLPLLRGDLNNFQVGTLFFVFGSVAAFTEIFAGALADKYGKKWFLVFGFISSALFLSYMITYASFIGMLVLTIILGISIAFIDPLLDAALFDSVGKSSRGVASGVSLSSAGLGYVVAPIIGGVLAQIGGYTMPLYFAAWLLVAGCILSIIFMQGKK